MRASELTKQGELQVRYQLIKTMLNKTNNINKIAELTGLPEKEIQKTAKMENFDSKKIFRERLKTPGEKTTRIGGLLINVGEIFIEQGIQQEKQRLIKAMLSKAISEVSELTDLTKEEIQEIIGTKDTT